MHQPAGLLAHRLDHGRVAVADRADRDPGEEVEVLLAVGVPEQRPLAADEVDRRPLVGPHQVALLERPRLLEADPLGRRRSWRDHRADAGVGEELEQQAVGDAAVDDVGRLGAAADRVDAGLQLRPHPAVEPRQRLLDLAHRGARDQRALVVGVGEPALDVGEEDRLVGAERGRDLAGRLVGVDVVGLAARGRRPRRRSPGCSRRRCG